MEKWGRIWWGMGGQFASKGLHVFFELRWFVISKQKRIFFQQGQGEHHFPSGHYDLAMWDQVIKLKIRIQIYVDSLYKISVLVYPSQK